MTEHHRAFLFTDIVGSTAKWEADSPEMLKALTLHDSALRDAIEPEAGVIFAHTGDGVAAAFETSSAAVRAAAKIVTTIAQQPWPGSMSIAVRVGLHAGEAHHVGDNWFGPTVNRTARVADAASAGQILATPAVTMSAELPADLQCVSHGRFPLKGLDEDLELIELAGSGGSLGVPRVRVRSRTNGTALENPLVGRTEDLEAIESALAAGAKVACITGVGGMGKTTLARAYADRHLAAKTGDVWWVDFIGTSDAADVAAMIERTVREVSGPDLSMRDGAGLLILDNCELVCEAVAEALTTTGPDIKVLATSRRPLGARGEIVHALHPLGEEGEGSAVELFAEVLRRYDQSRELDPAEVGAVKRLCALAGGMPLAIEVIASRCRSLPIEEAERLLGGSLRGLTDKSKSPRHASIEEVVRWSFDRLEPAAARVFTTLSLFRGFDFGTAARFSESELDPLALADCLDALVSESLLDFDGHRYSMLEPIRLFAAVELEAWDDRSEWDDRMVAAVLAHFRSLEQDWCRLHPLAFGKHGRGSKFDVANARNAVDICIARGDVTKATQLLKTAGGRLFDAGEFSLLRSLADKVLELARKSSHTDSLPGLIWAVGQTSWRMGEPAVALEALEEAERLYRDADDRFGSALATTLKGACLWDLGRLDETGRTMEQAREDWESVDPVLFGVAGSPLFYWYADNEPTVCRGLIDRAVDSADGKTLDPHVREIRALLAIDHGDIDEALIDLTHAAESWIQASNSGCLAHTLEAVALWCVETGRIDLAHMLRNALRTHRDESGIPPLALETMTSKRVDERLASFPAPPEWTNDGGSLGLFGAHQLLLAEVEASRGVAAETL